MELAHGSPQVQGFISAPSWMEMENGECEPTEEIIDKLVTWLVRGNYLEVTDAFRLREELLTLKYMASPSRFIRGMAYDRASGLPNGDAILAEDPGVYRVRRRHGDPPKTENPDGVGGESPLRYLPFHLRMRRI